MSAMKRRAFLETAAMGTAPLLAGGAGRAAPSEQVGVRVIGTGGQGRAHVKSYTSLPNVEVGYVCDLDDARRAQVRQTAPRARAVNDLRRVPDDQAVDAVSIATPDHWHTAVALLAFAAGKHVYKAP